MSLHFCGRGKNSNFLVIDVIPAVVHHAILLFRESSFQSSNFHTNSDGAYCLLIHRGDFIDICALLSLSHHEMCTFVRLKGYLNICSLKDTKLSSSKYNISWFSFFRRKIALKALFEFKKSRPFSAQPPPHFSHKYASLPYLTWLVFFINFLYASLDFNVVLAAETLYFLRD